MAGSGWASFHVCVILTLSLNEQCVLQSMLVQVTTKQSKHACTCATLVSSAARHPGPLNHKQRNKDVIVLAMAAFIKSTQALHSVMSHSVSHSILHAVTRLP
jgi:hypothetical protein